MFNLLQRFKIVSFRYSFILFYALTSAVAVASELKVDSQPPTESKVDYYILKSKESQTTYDYIQADIFLDTAMMYVLNSSNLRKKGEVYLLKGIIKKSLNDLGASLDFFINAMTVFEKIEDAFNSTRTYVNLAEFYRKTGKYEQATEFIQKAMTAYNAAQLNDLVLLNNIYNRSAAINNEYNADPTFSIRDSRKALSIAKKIPDSSLMAVSYNELGFSYKNLLKIDSSEYFYKEAERLRMSEGEYREAMHVMSNRAQLYWHNGYDRDYVISLYKNIVFLSDSLKIEFPLIDVSWALYTLYLEKQDTISAYRYFQLHHDETLILFNTQTRNELHNVNARFQNERIQNQYKRVTKELSESNKTLRENRKRQFFLISFVVILLFFSLLIIYLFFRLRKYNKELAEKNSEKDSLIQEIHHRVKNNLQFISSLINMQLKTAASKKEVQSLNETSRRINAMALVHEMLYNRANQKGISAKYYLEELIDSLYALISSDNQKIVFEMDIADIDLNVSDTISIGMITSELISNSMKHAFKHEEDQVVSISLKNIADNTYNYTIKDNGRGFKKELNIEGTLGLRLVDIFSRQLKGTYSIDGIKGFTYSLNFKTK